MQYVEKQIEMVIYEYMQKKYMPTGYDIKILMQKLLNKHERQQRSEGEGL